MWSIRIRSSVQSQSSLHHRVCNYLYIAQKMDLSWSYSLGSRLSRALQTGSLDDLLDT